jgi:hypothetical protein
MANTLIIHTGFVVELDLAAHQHQARVRIPALHGIPIQKEDAIKNSENAIITDKLITLSSYDISTTNNILTIDEDLPWYPICYPFGTNTPPNVADIVYVIMENTETFSGIVIGWTGRRMVYNSVQSFNISSSSYRNKRY